jgi:hypothetical protein
MHYAFTQFSLCQGLKKFPVQSKLAAMTEMKQLHNMQVFAPVNKSNLSKQELSQVLNSLMFIKEKQCGKFKAWACVDRRP